MIEYFTYDEYVFYVLCNMFCWQSNLH